VSHDPPRLTAALAGRYRIEGELGRARGRAGRRAVSSGDPHLRPARPSSHPHLDRLGQRITRRSADPTRTIHDRRSRCSSATSPIRTPTSWSTHARRKRACATRWILDGGREAQHSGLLARITVFGTPQHGGGPHWRDPVTAGELNSRW